MTSRRPAVLLALLAALTGSLLLAAPAAAAEKVVTITAKGVTPKVLEVAAGDTVRFVNNDASFGYRAVATSKNWDLDSGPVGLLPGRSYTHPDPIQEPGTYTYRVAEGAPFAGSVVLSAPTTVRPAPGGSGSPKPSGTSPTPSPSPSATGGSGTALPPMAGGFGTLPAPPLGDGGGVAPPPAIALPELPDVAGGPAPETAPEPGSGSTETAVPGRLAAPPTMRGYGLPSALAAVLAAGVASLLIRLLLAEPTARRGRLTGIGPGPLAAAD